jgi:two-component system, LytTR family, sensor kinase
MQKAWTPPARFVFGAATLLGVFSTLQAYRLSTLSINDQMNIEVWRLLALNLAYWYVPATLTSTIFRLANRFPLDAPGWPRALAVHALAALGLSVVHLGGMIGMRAILWPGRLFPAYGGSLTSGVQRIYLMNLDWALMTYSAIVGASYAIGYYRESRARAIRAAHLETRLAQARLKTLEAELHPHFLFNTLHAISTLVHTQPEAADRMISRLSDLLRITFSRSDAACVSLHEELEFLQKYLEIEQTRFQDRLTVDYQIDPDALDAEVPRLILQPLVENAIKHGVSPQTGPGIVSVGARRDNERLYLTVSDNGVGLTGRTRARLHGGVGLSNTRDRLECLYGPEHALTFLESSPGLTVEMRLPFRPLSSGSDGPRSRVA